MKTLACFGLALLLGLSVSGAASNTLDKQLEENQRALTKQLEQAQQSGNEKLAQALRNALTSLEHYKPAPGGINVGVSFLVVEGSGHYCRVPSSALIVTPQFTQAYPKVIAGTAPDAGVPVPFPQVASELKNVITVQYVTFEQDKRGFVAPVVSSSDIEQIKNKRPARLIVLAEPKTGEAIGGVRIR